MEKELQEITQLLAKPVLSQQDRDRLIKLQAAVDAEQAQIYALYPHLAFVPNPPQYRFIQMMAEGVQKGKWIFLAPWGNGVGKTKLWPNILWNVQCDPNHRTRWFDHPTFRDWQFPRRGRIVCNAKQLKEHTGAIWRAIHENWPASEFTEKKQGYEYPSMYRTSTGWIFDAMTFEQSRQDHESETLGIVVIDETCPYEIWSCYPSRLRQGGVILFLATLLENSDYVEEQIMTDAGCDFFYAADEDNCKEHGKLQLDDGTMLRGYLDHQVIERNATQYSEHERETRRTGLPIHKKGRVFHLTDGHHVSRSLLANMDLTYYMSVDPHQRKPWFMLVGGLDREGNWFIVDEWPRANFWKTEWPQYGLDFYVEQISKLEGQWRVQEKIIDSKFASQYMTYHAQARKLSEELLLTYGMYFTGGMTDPEDNGAREKLEGLLRYDQNQAVGIGNRPRFYLCDDLHNTRLALKQIRYKEYPDESRYGMSQKLDPKYLDPVRGIFYLIMHRGGYVQHGQAVRSSVELQRLEAVRKDLRQLGVAPHKVEEIAIGMI